MFGFTSNRIIKVSKSGIVFNASNSVDLKRKILSLNTYLIQDLRKNSLKYFNKNNWEKSEEKNYLKVYE